MQLRPYQNDLVEQVRQAWREGYKAPCIVLGCGGGKSCNCKTNNLERETGAVPCSQERAC